MKQIKHYLVEEEIGRGGMSTVYRAVDPTTETEVAIKLMHENLIGDEAAQSRFRQEVQTVIGLGHPAIVPILDYGTVEHRIYIVMAYLAGGTLRQRLDEGPLSMERSIAILQKVAQALDAAHAQNVIHRDVKPHNILLDEAGQAYLSDFGIARSMEGDGRGKTVTMIGTPEYVAPEQVTNGDLTTKTDIYQLGVTLFQMVTGQLPFSGSHYQIMSQHLNETLPSAESLNPLLPRGCDAVLGRATAKEPGNRYNSAGDFATALATLTEAHTATGLFTLPAALQTRLQGLSSLTATKVTAGEDEPVAALRARPSLLRRALVTTTGGVLAGSMLLFSLGAWPGFLTEPNLQTQNPVQTNQIGPNPVDLAVEDIVAEAVSPAPQLVTAAADEGATISDPSEVGNPIVPTNNTILSQNEIIELEDTTDQVIPVMAASEIINAVPQNDIKATLITSADERQTTTIGDETAASIQGTQPETEVNNASAASISQPNNSGDNPPLPPAQPNGEGNPPPPPENSQSNDNGGGNNGGGNGPNGDADDQGNVDNTLALSTAQANNEGNPPPPPGNSQGNDNGGGNNGSRSDQGNGGGGNNGSQDGNGGGGNNGGGGQGGGRGNRGG